MAFFPIRRALASLRTYHRRCRRAALASEYEGAKGMADRARYRAIVAGLPDETRAIFLLHRADGLEIAAIAQRTGKSTDEVQHHIAQALFALLTAFDPSLN